MYCVNRRHSFDSEDGTEYYYLSNCNSVYCDADGNTYIFDTYKEAKEVCDQLNEEVGNEK